MNIKEATNKLQIIASKPPSQEYREGWDRIFNKKKDEPTIGEEQLKSTLQDQ